MQLLTWIISLLTITAIELQIRKRWEGWLLSLFNQGLWLLFIAGTSSWGLLPLCGVMILQASRGLIRWKREQNAAGR